MSNAHVHPTMLEKLAPFIPLEKPHRVWSISINRGGQVSDLNLLSKSWFDALGKAVDLLDLPDDLPADGFSFTVKPAAVAFVDSVVVVK